MPLHDAVALRLPTAPCKQSHFKMEQDRAVLGKAKRLKKLKEAGLKGSRNSAYYTGFRV